MQTAQILFATLTGAFAGVGFGLVDASIPAPPELAGVMGIVGIYRLSGPSASGSYGNL